MASHDYDVALSFAGENREIAKELAAELTTQGVRVFFDEYEEHDLWGKELTEYFHDVFSRRAKYCIMLVSKEYRDKAWTRHERRSAFERAVLQSEEYILPIRLDDTELPGLRESVGNVRYSDYSVAEIAEMVVRKLGVPLSKPQEVEPKPQPPRPQEVTEDPRLARHQTVCREWWPMTEDYGYFALHSISMPRVNPPGAVRGDHSRHVKAIF
jgi:hypothetical protein